MFRTYYYEKQVYGRHGEDWNWHNIELRQVLKSILVVAAKSHTISIFIDTLNEASKSSVESIITYIYKVYKEL